MPEAVLRPIGAPRPVDDAVLPSEKSLDESQVVGEPSQYWGGEAAVDEV